jgi:hypothetical protein
MLSQPARLQDNWHHEAVSVVAQRAGFLHVPVVKKSWISRICIHTTTWAHADGQGSFSLQNGQVTVAIKGFRTVV